MDASSVVLECSRIGFTQAITAATVEPRTTFWFATLPGYCALLDGVIFSIARPVSVYLT